jgi:hypothetical protein
MTIKWTEETLKSFLYNEINEDNDVSSSGIRRNHRGAFKAANRIFGNYEGLFKYCGLNYESYAIITKWTKQSLANYLLNLIESGEPVNYNHVEVEHKSFTRASERHFGTYENLFTYCGLIYENYRCYTNISSYYGNEFEKVLGELFSEIGITYKQYDSGTKYKPDFVVGGRWFDAKLSETTYKNCDTIRNYEPHCMSLTIVYLRGNETDRMLTSKTRLIHVNKYVKQLPRSKRGYFYTKLNEIKEAI